MGNTILAHAVYACSESTFEPSSLFSDVGHAHKIWQYNKTNTIAWHADFDPRDDVTIMLNIVCLDWYEALRIKFSYSKWYLDIPSKGNFLKFGFIEPEDDTWAKHLTKNYHTLFQLAKNITYQSPIFLLGDYLTGELTPLRSAVEKIGWKWDVDRSNAFYNEMISRNRCYIDWLDSIKTVTDACVSRIPVETKLDFWEQALVTAKVCDIENIHPDSLHWDDYGCFLDTNNVSLIESLERIKNGKTI